MFLLMKKSQDKTEWKCFIVLAERIKQTIPQIHFVDRIISSWGVSFAYQWFGLESLDCKSFLYRTYTKFTIEYMQN